MSPPMIATPSGCRNSAPSPKPIASGNAPSAAASVVIRIGRKRSRQAPPTAPGGGRPAGGARPARGRERREPAGALGLEGEIDDEDGVLLDDADEKEDADQGDDGEVHAK